MVEFYKSKYFLVNLKVVLSNWLGDISNTNSECDGYSPWPSVKQLKYSHYKCAENTF